MSHPNANLGARARAAVDNPAGRFEKLNFEADWSALDPADEWLAEAGARRIPTQVFKDTSKTVVSTNDSPDIGMDTTLNPYRGCEHGCIYCYARPTHEYLGLSAGMDFETKIFAKPDAPRLLREKLRGKNWEPKTLTLSGITDCYQPLERQLKITRGCLEVLLDFRNPVAIITKNQLATRDLDLFKELAAFDCAAVNFSVTTLDPELARKMEPRTAQPLQRLRAIEAFAKAGVPVGIMIGPVIPGLTDHEIPRILKAVSDSSAQWAGYTMMRLPYGVKDLFQSWLTANFPEKMEKILGHVREVRGGKLNDAQFGTRMCGTGPYAEHVANMFRMYKKRYGLNRSRFQVSTAHFRRQDGKEQLSLF